MDYALTGYGAVCRPAISFSQGGEWKALISRYIAVMPLSGDARGRAEDIRLTTAEDARQQRHDGESRRGREA